MAEVVIKADVWIIRRWLASFYNDEQMPEQDKWRARQTLELVNNSITLTNDQAKYLMGILATETRKMQDTKVTPDNEQGLAASRRLNRSISSKLQTLLNS